jgi:hypothetical protein
MKFTEATKFHGEIRGRTPAALRSAIDREFTELTKKEETAQPDESPQQANSCVSAYFLAISRTRIPATMHWRELRCAFP